MLALGRLAACVSAAAVALTVGADVAYPALTLWPTCASPPGGDYARCEHGAFPQSIIGGPDGAMWFTTARADLGRVTAGGVLSQFSVPLSPGAAELLGGLTTGPDGALWFPAAFGPPYLYRATATAPPAFSAVLNPGDTQPRNALLGPDGAIWLAEAKSNTLGRFVPATGAYSSVALPAKARRHVRGTGRRRERARRASVGRPAAGRACCDDRGRGDDLRDPRRRTDAGRRRARRRALDRGLRLGQRRAPDDVRRVEGVRAARRLGSRRRSRPAPTARCGSASGRSPPGSCG